MKYFKLEIYTNLESTEEISNFLMEKDFYEFSIEGIEVRNEVLESKEAARWDFIEEKSEKEINKITLYFEEDEKEGLLNLQEELKEIKVVSKISYELVEEEQWKDKWKENYKAQRVSKKIIVKPTWETLEKINIESEDKIIEMDPGMAFGTGTHETTSMCIELLEDYDCKNKDIMDVGTGSGILAISATLLGASKVVAIDIDQDAVQVAKENIIKNKQEKKIEVIQADLTQGISAQADIIVANLISNLIIYLSKSIKTHMKEDGVFIVSGILIEQKEEVVNALETEGLKLEKHLAKNDWCALAFRRS